MMQATVYRTQWTDKASYEENHLIALSQSSAPRAHIINGVGSVREESWNSRGITLAADMQTSGVIRLKQFYFPVWKLSIDGKPAEGLEPEPGSGLMRVRAPSGNHRLELTASIDAEMGWRYTLAKIISFIAVGVLAFFALVYRRPAKSAAQYK